MMQSFYNGVGGITSQNFGIDLTANNIANVNTVGFKYSNSEFRDVFYSTVTSQSTNPAQSGGGVGAQSSKIVFSQGTPVASEGEFDVALLGKGFFGVMGSEGVPYYTRNGAFYRDANNHLVDGYGNYVLGTMSPYFTEIPLSDRVSNEFGKDNNGNPIKNGYTISSGVFDLGGVNAQGPISVPKNLYLPPVVTQNIKWSGNLDTGTKTSIVNVDLDPKDITLTKNEDGTITLSGKVDQKDIYSAKEGDRVIFTLTDANGVKKDFEATLDENLNFKSNDLDIAGFDVNSLSINSAFLATEQEQSSTQTLKAEIYNADGSKSWLEIKLDRVLPQVGDNIEYKATAQVYDMNGNAIGEESGGSLVFNKNGALLQNNIKSIPNPNGGSINIDLGSTLDPSKPGSGYDGLHILKDKESSIVTKTDGFPEGFFDNYTIGTDGSLIAHFSNGRNGVVGKIALYNFINEEGLMAMGNNLFAASANSGDAYFVVNNGNITPTADFKHGFLEQSNVELSTELTNLITMQKAFDASSKSITTSDEMIRNAINMKK
ncbi:flagellar hook-basal body complex protein [Campylobacter sp. US33a]|uniref:flagellar hook-basal body complex protein n=1 Tax=Campylobacter sp. US33a TaxID=2498120 RepID=UPI00106731FE|nr:flagellar hook-basal body complex protein [Campylobacter sp. US33a]TEY04456.1 flagellar hook protein FlgE [Campylobacter sp. US33a]